MIIFTHIFRAKSGSSARNWGGGVLIWSAKSDFQGGVIWVECLPPLWRCPMFSCLFSTLRHSPKYCVGSCILMADWAGPTSANSLMGKLMVFGHGRHLVPFVLFWPFCCRRCGQCVSNSALFSVSVSILWFCLCLRDLCGKTGTDPTWEAVPRISISAWRVHPDGGYLADAFLRRKGFEATHSPSHQSFIIITNNDMCMIL